MPSEKWTLQSCTGEPERVPSIRPEYGWEEWSAIDCLLLKGFQDVQVFHTRLSPSFITALIHGEQAVLVSLYKTFLSPLYADIIYRALDRNLCDEDQDEFIDILARAKSHTVPSAAKMKDVILDACHMLIQSLRYDLDAMASTYRTGLQKLLQSVASVLQLYIHDETYLSPKKVISLIESAPTTPGEKQAAQYLK